MKEKILKVLKWFLNSFIWLFIVCLILDIVTKNIIMNSGLDPNNYGSYFDWGFVHINYVLNPNAAFGIGADNPTVSRTVYLIVASLAVIGIIVYLIKKYKQTNKILRACFMLIITGAIGNMIDRIFYSKANYMVVDWIDFYWFWPYCFNIADCCIVIGAFILIIYFIVLEVKEYMNKNQMQKANENNNEKVLSVSEKERLERLQKDREEVEK